MKKYKIVSNSLDKGKIFISTFIALHKDDKNIIYFRIISLLDISHRTIYVKVQRHITTFVNRFVWYGIIGIESVTI